MTIWLPQKYLGKGEAVVFDGRYYTNGKILIDTQALDGLVQFRGKKGDTPIFNKCLSNGIPFPKIFWAGRELVQHTPDYDRRVKHLTVPWKQFAFDPNLSELEATPLHFDITDHCNDFWEHARIMVRPPEGGPGYRLIDEDKYQMFSRHHSIEWWTNLNKTGTPVIFVLKQYDKPVGITIGIKHNEAVFDCLNNFVLVQRG